MANENSLRDRWNLEAEDANAIEALNLAVERAKLKPGYRPGKSAPELELQARKNDLSRRQFRYFDQQQQQRDADVMNNGVSQRLDPQVDFSTHTPYVGAGKLAGKGMGELYAIGQDRNARESAVNNHVAGKKALAAKNFDAFQRAVDSRKVAEARGQSEGRLRMGERKENAKRVARGNFSPGDDDMDGAGDVTTKRDGLPLTMVSQRASVRDTPSVMARPSQPQGFEPAGTIHDDRDNDTSTETDESDGGVDDGSSAPMHGAGGSWEEVPRPKGYDYFRDTAPTHYDGNAEHGGVSADAAKAAAQKAMNFDPVSGRERSAAAGNDGVYAARAGIQSVYDQPTTELRGVARKQVFDQMAPQFTDRRKPRRHRREARDPSRSLSPPTEMPPTFDLPDEENDSDGFDAPVSSYSPPVVSRKGPGIPYAPAAKKKKLPKFDDPNFDAEAAADEYLAPSAEENHAKAKYYSDRGYAPVMDVKGRVVPRGTRFNENGEADIEHLTQIDAEVDGTATLAEQRHQAALDRQDATRRAVAQRKTDAEAARQAKSEAAMPAKEFSEARSTNANAARVARAHAKALKDFDKSDEGTQLSGLDASLIRDQATAQQKEGMLRAAFDFSRETGDPTPEAEEAQTRIEQNKAKLEALRDKRLRLEQRAKQAADIATGAGTEIQHSQQRPRGYARHRGRQPGLGRERRTDADR